MTLDRLNRKKIRDAIRDAYRRGRKSMDAMREIARGLDVRELAHYDVNSVAYVAADGGNQMAGGAGGEFFNPAMIEMVRVVDSKGVECLSDAIAANSEAAADWKTKTQKIEPLKKLCRDLGVNTVGELSPYLSGANRRMVIKVYREIAEWAVVYYLATTRDWGLNTMLVHEGPLRSGVFHPGIFKRLDDEFCKAHLRKKKQGEVISLAGISKSGFLINRLSTALALEGVFEKDYPCYAKIDYEVARQFYKKRWLETADTAPPDSEYRSMGEMFLVKFGGSQLSPVWMVDVARWQKDKAGDVLGQLAGNARLGFPIPDFPMCVQQAHDYAKIGPLEISVFSDMLIEEMERDLSPGERERLYRLKHLGEDITARRYRNA